MEDSENISNLLSVRLKRLGYEVFVTDTGQKAIAFLKAQSPDLMVLDFSLPDMNSKDLLQTLSALQIKIPPFIVTTGMGDERIAVDMMKLGAKDYLIKDISLSARFVETVERVFLDLEKDRKLLEALEALRRGEERYRLIAENALDVIWIYNVTRECFEYISPSVYQLRSFTPSEAMSQSFEESLSDTSYKIIKPEIELQIDNFLKNPVQYKPHLMYQIQQPCRDGSLVWVEVSIQFQMNSLSEIEILGVSRNIEQRKSMERILVESEERFRSFVEKSADIFVRISTDGRFLYVSPNWREYLGHNQNEVLRKHFSEFVHPDDVLSVLKEFESILEGEAKMGSVEYRIFHKDGSIRWFYSHGFMVNEGSQMVMNVISRDITEKRLAESRLIKAVVDTEERERSRFAAQLHEEIGPTLASIKMHLSHLKQLKAISAKNKLLIENMEVLVNDGVSRVRGIANDLVSTVLIELGLSKGLQSFVRKVNSAGDLFVDFNASGQEILLSQDSRVIIYRCVVDLVMQTLKFQKASSASLSLQWGASNLIITYWEDSSFYSYSEITKDIVANEGPNQIKSRIKALDGLMEVKKIDNNLEVLQIIIPLDEVVPGQQKKT